MRTIISNLNQIRLCFFLFLQFLNKSKRQRFEQNKTYFRILADWAHARVDFVAVVCFCCCFTYKAVPACSARTSINGIFSIDAVYVCFDSRLLLQSAIEIDFGLIDVVRWCDSSSWKKKKNLLRAHTNGCYCERAMSMWSFISRVCARAPALFGANTMIQHCSGKA